MAAGGVVHIQEARRAGKTLRLAAAVEAVRARGLRVVRASELGPDPRRRGFDATKAEPGRFES